MIDTKMNTKTWREPTQGEVDLRSQGSSRQLTSQEKDKLGADDIGGMLNKLSDPNYVDPSKKSQGAGSNKMDKDAFFKLMLAQLKNQDPSNPLKNHEMAAQLAQFSTLEQMTNMNTTLNEIKGAGKPAEQFQALNLIGKQVAGDSAKITRTEIDKEHEFKFTLPQDVDSAEIRVVNNKNEVIRTFKFSDLKQGENKISWNGQNDRGLNEKAGDYRFVFEGKNSSGQSVNPKTEFTGVITGIGFSMDGPVIQIGKQNVRLKDIRQFSDPSLKSNDQNSKDITQLDLKKNDPMRQTNFKEEAKTSQQLKAEAQSADDLFNQVGMSSELMDKVRNGG